MANKVLARYTQQPGEVRSRSISFKRYLDRMGDSAMSGSPIEKLVPDGLTVVADAWVDAGGYYKALIQGVAGKHKLTVWLNTTGGQRLEADIVFVIKDV